MDTNKLSRSPEAMRPLPRTRSASDVMTPRSRGSSASKKDARPISSCLHSPPLPRPRSRWLHLLAGKRVPGEQQQDIHALPPPTEPATTRQHTPRAPPRPRDSEHKYFRPSWCRRNLYSAQAYWVLGVESGFLGSLYPPGRPTPTPARFIWHSFLYV